MKILAMDVSLSQPGFAVLEVVDGEVYVRELAYVKTNTKESHGFRLEQIASKMEDILERHDVEYIVREKGFSRHAHVTQTLYKVMGVTELLAHMDDFKGVEDIPVTSVKKLVTGNGKASKEEVAECVFEQVIVANHDEFYEKKRNGRMVLVDDLTDACAVGLAFLRQEGYID